LHIDSVRALPSELISMALRALALTLLPAAALAGEGAGGGLGDV